MKNLVIVESPGKTKTIEKFLGKDYHVLSSQGHIRDIEGVGKNNIGIDFEHGYAPHYVIDAQKTKLIETLRQEANKADKVWLASDEDREGEAIAWHLNEVLALDPKKTRRIVFHEITESAIKDAIQHPRDIDYNLVNAQQARRVLDRIVGFELSPILWKKVSTGLSAGRVQSVAVRLVVEREREIEQFKPTAQYRVTAEFTGSSAKGDAVTIRMELNHRFATKASAEAFLEQCRVSSYTLSNIQHKISHRSPQPPFTTSTLQQEAARKLHFPVSKTMRLAQSLYEAGKITYMRTDSVHLSSLAIGTAREQIISEFGEPYHKARQFTTSSKGAQEAHEAIRPAYMNIASAGENADEKRLYELIRRRALASQMADAEIDTTRLEVNMQGCDYLWVATAETILFDGFMRVYQQSSDSDTEDEIPTLPEMNQGQVLTYTIINAQETYSKPPQRYNEATLVKKMEELGIGRPSTYATVIDTIQTRHYVERGSKQGVKREYNLLTLRNGKISSTNKNETVGTDSGKLIPTDLGCITNDFLVEHFPKILSYDFTAHEEENFDTIAEGKQDWVSTVDDFYHDFHPLLTQVPKGKIAGRLLGDDPASGKPVYARISRNGPCIQIGNGEDEEKPRFASLEKGQSIFTITLDEALKLFDVSYPYTLCEWEGEPVTVGIGRFGPYIKYFDLFVSIPKTIDPKTITEEQAHELVFARRQQMEPIKEWGTILLMNGRYGAYIKTLEGNYKIPRSMDIEKMTLEDCQKIISTTQPTASGGKKKSFSRKKAK